MTNNKDKAIEKAVKEFQSKIMKEIDELKKKAIEYDENTIGWYDEDWNRFIEVINELFEDKNGKN